MSERPKADVIERVRKILAKTEQAGCTPEEAEAAFQMASRIMAEHNLDMAEIESKEGGEPSWLEEEIQQTGRWSLEQNLAYSIAKQFFFVEGFFTYRVVRAADAHAVRYKVLRFFGTPENLAAARWVYTALLEAFDRLFHEYRQRTGALASDRRLFIAGVADGFEAKLTDERKAVEIERDLLQGRRRGGTEIMLRSIMDQTTEAYRKAHPPAKKKARDIRFTKVTGDQSALEAGYHAGRNLNLNRAIGQSNGIPQHKGLPGQ
jgi:hypothetical protein